MFTPLTLAAVVVLFSVVTALAALTILSRIPVKRVRKPKLDHYDSVLEQTIFLFEGHELVDTTRTARSLLDRIDGQGTEWDRLVSYIAPKIPRFTGQISEIQSGGVVEFVSDDTDGISVIAETIGAHLRLTLVDLTREGQGVLIDGLSLKAQVEELTSLRESMANSPVLVWRTDKDNVVCWANAAYIDLAAKYLDGGLDDLTWPLPVLLQTVVAGESEKSRRQKIHLPDTAVELWFECHSFPAGKNTIHYALPADATVKAEQSLREFVQTLTKTFAHLPIGLAVFDRQRQLALFNPALTDLTSLDPAFLSGRPALTVFLDRLREVRIIPEPKDYRAWRQQMTELEKEAASGFYEDTWSLPTGQTYKVTGRPHPDGAVAFLIEDITSEVTLTRHFRSEIELGQAVVDTLDEAIAVYSPVGELILSNAAYADLWGSDPGNTLGMVTIGDCTRLWQAMTEPSPVWNDVRSFIEDFGERIEWGGEVQHRDGRTIQCRLTPLTGGRTLVGFCTPASTRRPARRIRHSRKEGHDALA